MAIRISRNDQGNCINFYGSSNPTHWNACLSGQVDPQNNQLVNVVNDITTSQAGSTQYEFYNIPYTEFLNEEGEVFNNAQEVADYITLKGNVTVGLGVTYQGIWNPDTNTPDITTDTSRFNAGDFYKVITVGTADLGSGDVEFVNGDEVIFDGTNWERKPFAGALIEYDSTSVLLNNNPSVYADAAQGLEEPNGAEQGWYFINDEAGKKINWYFLGNQNAGYQMNKSTLQGGYARIKVLQTMGTDSPFIALYTTPLGDGYDAFWFRSRYVYTGDFTGVAANQEVIAYWGDEPNVHPELVRVQLTLNAGATLLSTAPDISQDAIYTMALNTNSAATVDSIEFIAKELGYKNQQYTTSFLLEAKLEAPVVSTNNNDLSGEVIDFQLDATSTSIMLDNGYSYGVNTIKALNTGNGLIALQSIQGDLIHFINLDHTNVTVNGESVSGGLNDVINTLNELFTVGAFQSVVISDPYSTMVADVDGEDTTSTTAAQGSAIEVSSGEFGATTSGYNVAGYKTPETINQAGEYFTFDIRNEGIIGFGLIPSQTDYDNGNYNGNASYADPSTFCNGVNSGHYGYQFSHWFHPSPNGPWTNYGANTTYSIRPGWNNRDAGFVYNEEGTKWVNGDVIKMKVGIDENNFIVISYYDESTSLFVPIARTSYPVPNGNEYHLGIKFGDTTVRLMGVPKIHTLEDLAPTLYYRYIESPDGNFEYPLFATAAEANYVDEQNGGSGTSHTHTYADDPTNTTWYMPDTGGEMSGTAAPTDQAYTEITSLTNADLTPAQFSSSDITQEEGTAINMQLMPADATFSQSVDISPSGSGLVYNTSTHFLQGTLADVGSDTVYTITVTRANSYGSSTGSFTITATDVAPVSTMVTPWTKALDFSGSNEHASLVSQNTFVSALRMGGKSVTVPANSDANKTSNDSQACPWATAIVFKYDGNSSNQHIWNSGEGASSGDDNIYLRLDSSGHLYFGWGRQGALNECKFLYLGTSTNTNHWHGIYIAHNGTRLSGSNATAANLAAAFDIRWFTTNYTGGEFGSSMDNKSTVANWTAGSTGGRMDRSVTGDFTIGGRGGNRNFHGKVASMVMTTLRTNVDMPSDAEIELMISDPLKWEDDYMDGELVRWAYSASVSTYTPNNYTYGYAPVQIWLMGDGTNDSYANGIRNQVHPTDASFTKLQLNSMVSNDIETVNINGLT